MKFRTEGVLILQDDTRFQPIERIKEAELKAERAFQRINPIRVNSAAPVGHRVASFTPSIQEIFCIDPIRLIVLDANQLIVRFARYLFKMKTKLVGALIA